MNYEKQTFVDGEVLTAEQLNHMEKGIADVASITSNPNLLDNWYFIDPINQRGSTTYMSEQTAPYTIDRWVIGWNTQINLNGNNTGISIAGEFAQRLPIETLSFVEGKNVTLSVLLDSGVLYVTHGFVNNSVFSTYDGDFEKIMLLSFGEISGTVRIQGAMNIVAAKLELGSQQTLARQENGVWVLNDPPPNKQQELAKCQRYQQVISGARKIIGIARAYSATEAYVSIFIPTSLRIKNAVISDVSKIGIMCNNPYLANAVPISSIYNVAADTNCFFCFASIASASLTAGELYAVAYMAAEPHYVVIDANL